MSSYHLSLVKASSHHVDFGLARSWPRLTLHLVLRKFKASFLNIDLHVNVSQVRPFTFNPFNLYFGISFNSNIHFNQVLSLFEIVTYIYLYLIFQRKIKKHPEINRLTIENQVQNKLNHKMFLYQFTSSNQKNLFSKISLFTFFVY